VPEPAHARPAAAISELARSAGLTVAVAESLTGGMISSALAAAEAAAQWFRGSLVAYSSEVKHEVLGVPDGPVVSAEAAGAMATGVRGLLGADLAVAVTGAGGPDSQDGAAPGTVYIAVDDGHDIDVLHRRFAGDPPEVCASATELAMTMLVERLRAADRG
jgi:nicotinamide-nucleotide amidase